MRGNKHVRHVASDGAGIARRRAKVIFCLFVNVYWKFCVNVKFFRQNDRECPRLVWKVLSYAHVLAHICSHEMAWNEDAAARIRALRTTKHHHTKQLLFTKRSFHMCAY